MRPKLIRASTVPSSLNSFCKGLLKELSKDYIVIALSSHGPEMQSIKNREGVRTIEVDMERHISLFKDFISLIKLCIVFLREKPDIVHSITPKAGLLCMVSAWLTKVPIRIHTFTGLVFPTSTGIRKHLLMFTDWLTCACATHIIPEGEGVKDDLLSYKITKKPLAVLGYGNVRGVDLTYYDRTTEVLVKAENLRCKDLFTFLFIGRVVKDKGINELIEASERLFLEDKCFRVIIVGPYEDKFDPISSHYKKIISDASYITAIGQVADVRPWLAASDALVLPSYREGFPNVVLEAGAFGLPSIVTDINGSREIIVNGVNGLIVKPMSSEELLNAMRRFLTEPNEVKRMSLNCRKMIAERFEQSFVRKCQKEYYIEALKSKDMA